MSYSAAKLSFGVFGIAAAAVQGKEIIEQNGIENPAPQLVKALFDAAQAPYGLNAPHWHRCPSMRPTHQASRGQRTALTLCSTYGP
jgi:hypothetical protein